MVVQLIKRDLWFNIIATHFLKINVDYSTNIFYKSINNCRFSTTYPFLGKLLTNWNNASIKRQMNIKQPFFVVENLKSFFFSIRQRDFGNIYLS